MQRGNTNGVRFGELTYTKSNQNKLFNKIPAHNVINRKARDLHSLVVPLVHVPLMRNRARARQSRAFLFFFLFILLTKSSLTATFFLVYHQAPLRDYLGQIIHWGERGGLAT